MSFDNDDQLMQGYLLGTLPPEALALVDERLAADPVFFDRLEAFEDDLIVQWHRRQLSASDQKAFELAYVNPVRQARIEQALHVIRIAATQRPASRPTVRPYAMWALAASLVLVVGSIALLPRVWSTNRDGATLLVALTAVGERSATPSAGYDLVRLLPDVTTVRLKVDLPDLDGSVVPQVEVSGIDYPMTREYTGSAVQWVPRGGVLTVSIPAAELLSGDYLLIVSGAADKSDIVVRRALRVTRDRWHVTIGPVRSCRDMTADDQLHGWKDIARHLGVQVRTAQRYERRGLPIRRNDAIRGGVYAVKAELQAWRDGFGSAAGPTTPPLTSWHGMVTLSEPLAPGRYVVSLALTAHEPTLRQT